jgi:Ca-activated chloride channel family protein
VKLGNAQSRAATGKDLLGPTDNLVLSPTIIAMWKPMAEAMGWPGKPIGWADIIARAQDPNGWGTVGHPEWGRFKLGHTHPEFSNSGLQAVFAIVYAGVGKLANLTFDDVARPDTARFMNQVQSAIQHYGSSTGFFNDKMIAGGPGYLSAAVLYENLVIEANKQHRDSLTFPLVAVYPKEGTFWADHPVGIVDRQWVTPAHREAAKAYIQYLLDRPQQEAAMKFGFRPADPAIPLGDPLVAANGVDPQQPTTTLEVPSPEVMQAAIDLWKREKKKASVVLVFDTSGSMKQDNRMGGAKAGAVELLKMLGEDDTLSLLPFSSQPRWAKRDVAIRDGRTQAIDLVNNLIPDGGTALYNSIDEAYRYLQDNPQPGRIAAVVVLTDGEDTAKQMKLDDLLKRLAGDVEARPVRVFSIGYGADANEKVLRQIADVTRGKYYKGDPKNIRDVFKDIATFF